MENFKHINLDYLKEISEGNNDLVHDLISLFIKQVPVFNEQLDNYYNSSDYNSLGKLAHKIKSSVAMMGIKELTADMKTLEYITKQGVDKEKYQTYILNFKKISSEAIVELNTIIINLK